MRSPTTDINVLIWRGLACCNCLGLFIPIDVNLEDQPISIEWTANALGSVLSTVGTASATCQLECAVTSIVPVGESANLATRETRRIYSFTRGAIASEQEIQGNLPTGVTIDNISLGVTTDSNLTDVTLKATGRNIIMPDAIYGVTLKQPMDFLDHLVGYMTDDKGAFYKKDAGPYSFQKQDSPKFINDAAKIFGITGSQIDPVKALKGQEFQRRK